MAFFNIENISTYIPQLSIVYYAVNQNNIFLPQRKPKKENMIYGKSLGFKELIQRIEELQPRFRKIEIQIISYFINSYYVKIIASLMFHQA